MTRRSGFGEFLYATGAFGIAEQAEQEATFASIIGSAERPARADELATAARMLEMEALDERDPIKRQQLFEDGFACWLRLALSGVGDPFSEEVIDEQLALVLHLAATGTAAARVTETRQALARFLPSDQSRPSTERDWVQAVLSDSVLAFVLLVRKGGGWDDVSSALELLQSLRQRQHEHEQEFLASQDSPRTGALRLVAAYHLAQLTTTAGKFIETGRGAVMQVSARLDTHRSQALRAVAEINDGRIARIIDLVHVGMNALVQRSIWAQVETLGSEASEFASVLAGRQNASPTLELWPSQVEAMGQSLLDAYRRAIVVQMPTSAGKTLLAKFSIVQTHALNPQSRIAYIVPTRVLVNQITDDLRRDLGPLNIEVEQAVPVVDVDPTEDILLASLPDVLVTTPEKLDLLVRTEHPVIENLSMVIVDEAHNIAEANRGARLELLLATIRRDKPAARFLLLSPFMPNAESLSSWLGGDRGSSIRVQWKPNKKFVGQFEIRKEKDPADGRRKNSFLDFVAVGAADNYHVPPGSKFELGQVDIKSPTLSKMAAAAQEFLEDRGATLVVCAGRPTAIRRANEIASRRAVRTLTPHAESIVRHVATELGADSVLERCVRRGVAYHHSGMSLDTRRLVESLLERGDVDVVCGTTTLAQGANFPLANVIVESMRIGRDDITHSQFWNIAGRAGRGMLSGLGVVGYPVSNAEQAAKWRTFFSAEAESIASRLAKVVEHSSEIGTNFLAALNKSSDIESLSEFLQYLAHAMRVSGSIDSANEIEDLLRSSLVFSETERVSRDRAQVLVQFCRNYLASLQGRGSLVTLADGTGFSTPSINLLLGGLSEYPSLRNVQTWDPSALFGSDLDPLANRLELVSRMPEIHLSPDDEPGLFNPVRAARIVRDWVNGMPIDKMVERHARAGNDPIKRHADFVNYLLGRLSQTASWGLGALEKVALAGGAKVEDQTAQYVPTMVYYGVNSPEATWMRMAGLPRDVARGAADIWVAEDRPAPQSFSDIRGWVSDLSDAQWTAALRDTRLRPEDARRLWAQAGN